MFANLIGENDISLVIVFCISWISSEFGYFKYVYGHLYFFFGDFSIRVFFAHFYWGVPFFFS